MATDVSQIRTIAITGQGGVGKTSVADSLAFAAGANTRLGRVDEETSLFDTEPEEIRRRCSITSSIYSFPYQKYSLTVVDTPGQGNFVTEAAFALRGVGGNLLVVDPTSSVRAETAKVWNWARQQGVPSLIVVNRIDRSEIDLDGTLERLKEKFDARPAILQLPIRGEEGLRGIVDVLEGKAYLYSDNSGKFETADVPADMVDAVDAAKGELVECAAEGDDALLERYLEEGELSAEETQVGLRAAIASGSLAPVLCVSAEANVGFPQLLDAVVALLPPPSELAAQAAAGSDNEVIAPDASAPFCGFVFKTIVDPHAGHLSVIRVLSGTLTAEMQPLNVRSENKERLGHLLRLEGRKTAETDSATVGEIVAVAKLKSTHVGDTLADPSRATAAQRLSIPNPAISFAVEAAKRGEEDKAMQGLVKLCEEDPALHVDRDEESGEILVSGAGQLHVEVACERLTRKYGAAVNLKAPKVPYRETIRKKVQAHGRLKKQTGGHGQFADCRVEMEPLPHGGGFEFINKIVGGAIPRGFIPAVEKGVLEAMKSGSIAGCPVVDVRVTLHDGQYHDVDSSEMAFKIAGSMAFRAGLDDAKPALLEPYVQMEITVPDATMGDVLGDLNSRRAKVEGMEQLGHDQVIRAKVPMSEVLRYAPDLTSMTAGAGSFEMGFSHYEQAPEHLVQKIVQDREKKEEA